MLAIFNLVLLPMYYKTAYKYGAATSASNAAALLFAGAAQWIGIQSPWANDMLWSSYERHDFESLRETDLPTAS